MVGQSGGIPTIYESRNTFAAYMGMLLLVNCAAWDIDDQCQAKPGRCPIVFATLCVRQGPRPHHRLTRWRGQNVLAFGDPRSREMTLNVQKVHSADQLPRIHNG